jgi:phage baseplate assembly protein W
MANLFDRDDIALGIKLPFGPGQSNFALNYTTLDQAKTDLVNLLLTHKGERFMQPEFGTNLRRFLFKPNTSEIEGELRNEILDTIKRWLPFIKVGTLRIHRDIKDINQYTIRIALDVSVIDDITKFSNITFVFGSDGTVLVENI